VKNCIFEHITDKIFSDYPPPLETLAHLSLPKVEMLEPPLCVSLSVWEGVAGCQSQVQAMEDRLDEAKTVSVDREVLGEQIQDQQTLAVDMDNRRPRVHALSDNCSPHNRATVDQLLDRFDALQTRSWSTHGHRLVLVYILYIFIVIYY